jgi:hypothetical protein
MLPLTHENDYAAIAALPSLAKNVRVLVTMVQMQELMASIVENAKLHLAPFDLCLLTARMPAGPRIPARLLMSDVFLVGDLDAECKRLAARGFRFLAVDNRLVRHSLDAGDNTVTFEWFHQSHDLQAWNAFVESVAAMGFVGVPESSPVGELP